MVDCFGSMYFFLTFFLGQQDPLEYNVLYVVSRVCAFSTRLLSFLAMTVSASLVAESFQEVGCSARNLLQFSDEPTYALKKFWRSAERDVSLTAWKIVPIRRSFIVGTVGALLTYVVLVDSLK
ncbi:hypothetical protein JTE90_029052 [Oedothorax gibbosus]|uniref:Gustatory receptor n=1 Tax=Oedothorax gibbosus TaxID=931172 RepID=A0AAV6UWW5_9ARAC|nr:hypothetical protein JTE90_029052 [Oedothorax gibbosus]